MILKLMSQDAGIANLIALATTHVDFGYPWWLSYGHLVVAAGAGATHLLAHLRKWSKWILALTAIITLWAVAGFLIVYFGFNAGSKGSLPTEAFLRSGQGRVLDIGAGTGRSSIMVLESRPKATLVALDLFGGSFEQHFGAGEKPQDRLLSNLKVAGVDQRVSIVTSDMRKTPFENASFDAAVSAYAIDHLNRQGSAEALAEAARVVKPGGELLLMVITKEPWIQFAFGPLLAHGGARDATWWNSTVQQVGFDVVEQGTRPATLYILARRRG